MTESVFKVLALKGSFTLDNPNTDPLVSAEFNILSDEPITTEGINPAKGLYGEPMVTTRGFGQYGTARSIEELQGAVESQYPDLYWWLFNLVAVYRDLSLIAFSIEGSTWAAYIEAPGKNVYAWINSANAGKIFVIENLNDSEPGPTMDPSEIMQAFTTTAEHVIMGSKQFLVQILPERAKFVVSMFDHEMKDHRLDIDFRLRSLDDSESVFY